MGKPSDQAVPPGASSSSSRPGPPPQRYFDDDPTELSADNLDLDLDLPPLYEEIAGPREIPGRNRNGIDASLLRVDFGNSDVYGRLGPAGLGVQPFRRDPRGEAEYYVDSTLARDPGALEQALRALARVPPRPFAVVRGTHTETRQRGDDDGSGSGSGRSEDRTVVDFDVEIEMTHLLFASPAGGVSMDMDVDLGANSGTQLRVAGNQDYVRRGTVLRSYAPGFSSSSSPSPSPSSSSSAAALEAGAPSVQEWCHRFCASGAGLKALRLERRAVGFDLDLLAARLEDAVRATNYRGRVDVSFPVRGARVEILNDCRTNRWRLTRWVVVLCCVTLLFVVTWPWLWLRTKRWDTFYTEWRFSEEVEDDDDDDNNNNFSNDGARPRRYTSMSEQAWLDMWTRALQTAVLQRRRGQLDQRDLVSANAAAAAAAGLGMDAPGMEAFAGAGGQLEAMGIVNRWFGWGGERSDGAGRGGWGGDRRGRIRMLPRFGGRRSW
ncbi:hypothetical protein ESCO_005914 [Escovopsis weberi]|uniref:Uncharacterized protein n=1 Tax=Escovopsis weberi TaxID=150374 RepID=A0A0M8N0D0_ESCWE|nr:hypothetical protein ESCO_005914 [Escovopsis weberi]